MLGVGALPHAPYSCSWWGECCSDAYACIYLYIHVCMYYGMHMMHIEINNILRTNISF